ncbi:MAG: L,D-transpeptidase family protein [Pseudomonadales bacterium]
MMNAFRLNSFRTLATGLMLCMLTEPAFAEAPPVVDLVTVHKADRQLELWSQGRVVRRYAVALGWSPVGHKRYNGDGRTPEGDYVLDFRNENSAYYRSIRISYPSAEDERAARASNLDPGGDIMIHGQKNGASWAELTRRYRDWTLGCIAVTNAEMDEIWSLVPLGTPIRIQP